MYVEGAAAAAGANSFLLDRGLHPHPYLAQEARKKKRKKKEKKERIEEKIEEKKEKGKRKKDNVMMDQLQ